MINDLVGGHIKLATMGATPAIPFHKAGTLLLAQSGDSRSISLPDVPTFQDAGFRELALAQWVGVFAPAGVPAAIADKLNADLGKAIASKPVRDALLVSAMDVVGGTRAAFTEFVRTDVEKYGRLEKQLEAKK